MSGVCSPHPPLPPLSFTLCVTVIDLTSVPVYVRIRPGHDFPGSSSELGRVNDYSVVPRYVQSLSQVPVISTRMLTKALGMFETGLFPGCTCEHSLL